MKKLLFVLVLLVIGSTGRTLEAQTGWIQTGINPGTGYSLYATDTELYAATYNGVYSTADSGNPWFSKGPDGHSVFDIIKTHQYLLAATYDGVYRSSDDGNSWLPTNGSPHLSGSGGIIGPHVFAKNSGYVFVIAWAQGIFRSGDDGKNWQQLYLGQYAPGYQDYAAAATCIGTVGENVFIGVEMGVNSTPSSIYSTSDNGNTWVGSQFPSGLLCFYNDNGKLFAGGFMGVYLGTDLGNSWSTQYSGTIDSHGHQIGLGSFRDVVSYNQNLIAAVDFQSIQISRDNGKSWTSFNDGLISDWAFAALSIKAPYVWAIRGGFGNAYRRSLTEIVTKAEWTVQNSRVTTPLRCVKAVNQSVAWAAGDNGRIVMTTDGGSNWNSEDDVAVGVDQIFSIEALDGKTAFVAKTSSSGSTCIYRTSSGGTSWTQVFSQPGGFIDGIKMYDANNGIALGDPVGGKWTLLSTTDRGTTWGRIATEPAQVGSEYGFEKSLATYGSANIWFGTGSHRIYHSTNGGTTWSSQYFPYGNCYSIAFTDAQRGLAGSDSGYVCQTTNGGITWSYIAKLDTGAVSGLCGLGNDFFCAAGNIVYRSANLGITWKQSFVGTSPLKHFSFVANGSVLSGWAVDYNGNIAAFSSTVTDVENRPQRIPTGFDLQQNYPNPFNPSTTISFSLPSKSFVSLKVFDLLGREVTTIVSEELSSGNYSRQWNATGMPSGVYFYRLQAGSSAEVKKLDCSGNPGSTRDFPQGVCSALPGSTLPRPAI